PRIVERHDVHIGESYIPLRRVKRYRAASRLHHHLFDGFVLHVADRTRLQLPRPYDTVGCTVSGAVHRPHDTPANDLPIRLLYVGGGELYPAQRGRHQRLTLPATGFE